jgi:hypothetical protein
VTPSCVHASDAGFVSCRRAPQQPLLSFSAEAAAVVPHAVQQLLTDGMQQLQQLGAGGRFGLELGVMQPELHREGEVTPTPSPNLLPPLPPLVL